MRKLAFLAALCMVCTAASAQYQHWVDEVAKEKLHGKAPHAEAQQVPGQKPPAPNTLLKAQRSENADAAVFATNFPESELHAALCPADSNRLVVAVMQYADAQGGGFQTPIFYSHDFGETWKKADINVFAGPGKTTYGGGDPVFCWDADGETLYYTYIDLYNEGGGSVLKWKMAWLYSKDAGKTWVRPHNDTIGFTEAVNGSFQVAYDKQWLAADASDGPLRNTIYIAYYAPSAAEGRRIMLRRKLAGNLYFDEEVRISPQEMSEVQYTSIDVDMNGWVHVTFMGRGNAFQQPRFHHAVSKDGGETFELNEITEFRLPRLSPDQTSALVQGINRDRMIPYPQLAISKAGGPTLNHLYLVFTANGIDKTETNGLDVFITRSEDGGATWSAPMRVNDGPEGHPVHQHHSTIYVNSEGNIVVGYYDRRVDGQLNFALSYSTDGGQTFTPSTNVSSMSADPARIGSRNNQFGFGEYVQVLSTPHTAIPFWADARTNDGNINVYFAKVAFGQENTSVPEARPLSPWSMKLFPNPAHDQAMVVVESPSGGQATIAIVSADGKIQRMQRQLLPGTNQVALPVQSLSPGIYRVVVEVGTTRMQQAIVVVGN